MNRARNVVLLVLLCLSAAAVEAQEWRGPASIALEVKGKPQGNVDGALVILRYQQMEPPGGPRPVLTDSAGLAVLVDLAPGVWEVEVSHDDFLSFVALVLLDPGRKPAVQASFLQASGSSLTPIRVKFMDGKGKTPSASVPLPPEAAARLAQRRPPPPPRPPAGAPETSRVGSRTTRPPQPVMPEPELRPLPETARPAGKPSPPPLAEPVPQQPAVDRPEPAAIPQPEPAPPVQAPVAPPRAMPDPPTPEAAAPEPAPPPVQEPVQEPEQEPMVPPVPEPQPAATEPEPSPETPRPVPPPAMPAPEPEPVIPQPEPAVPERTAPPEAEPPTPEPAAPPAPGPAPLMPPPAAPPLPAPEPAPSLPEPAATPEPQPTPPAIEPSAEPMAAPDAAASSPEPEPPMPEAMPEEPKPKPVAPPAPDTVLPAPGPLGPTLRAYRDRTCVECRPGEWAISVEAVAGPASAPCTDSLDADGRELSALLGGSIALELKEVAAPASQAIAQMGSAEPWATATELLGDDSNACRIVAAVIPKAGRFRGLRMEAADASGVGDCQADRPCPVGRARWIGQPRVSREPSSNVIWGLFVNEAPDRSRRARLTVYFAAPSRAWDPSR